MKATTLVFQQDELWFQQDGATCHTARATIDLLKDMFGDRLISRFGPVNWPPRSCDLTPLNYFLWGYVKSLVYADKPQTLAHLEDNIRRVIANRRPQMYEKVIEDWTTSEPAVAVICQKSYLKCTEELSSGEIKAMFLPPNVTPLLQPMDQGVLQKLKQIYLLKKLWPTLEYAENQPENDVTSLLQLVQTISGCEEARERDINKWMEEDGETAEFLTDDDIAAAVTQEPMEEEGSDDETQCDKKDVVPHADDAAALDLALRCATWSNSPTLHQLMCYL
ncbi:uncharacterized protein TNCV_1677601 [Trichonephila clavipes]|nr:uncharacterized protein TNCV_1677601 [Trichonephila clavipes]